MNVDGVESFTPSRLVLARERRGFTQRQLRDDVDVNVSDRSIKAYESGAKRPSSDTVAGLAKALDFPSAFFSAPPIDRLTLEAASFRALTKAGATLRGRAVAAGTLAMEFHRYLAERFDLPRQDVPDLRISSTRSVNDERRPAAAAAAEAVRQMWGLGQKPIHNMIHLLELHGVRVFSLSEDCESIDAFSVWRDGTPFVFLNTRKTPERSIFDAAHELGHLVMHQHGIPQGRETEREADAFAASFILPESAIRAEAPQLVTIASLASMKRVWHASVALLGHRLHELRIMSEWQYRHFNIELARRGRKNEPSPLPRETSAIIRKTLAALADEGLGFRAIARELHLPLGEIRAMTFGLAAIEGDGGGATLPKGALRLVTT